MSWQDSRGSGATTALARRAAHSDDAKQRTHDASHLRTPRFPKWVPLVVAGAVVVLLVGGTTAVVATRGGDRAARTAPSTVGGPDGTTSTKKGASTPGLGVDGSLTGTLTITGTGHGYVRPYLGDRGQGGSAPATLVFLCTPAKCTNQHIKKDVLTRLAPGTYGLTRQVSEGSTHGPLNYAETISLKVVGSTGTYTTSSTGAFAGKPPHDFASHPPQGYALSGPASFK